MANCATALDRLTGPVAIPHWSVVDSGWEPVECPADRAAVTMYRQDKEGKPLQALQAPLGNARGTHSSHSGHCISARVRYINTC